LRRNLWFLGSSLITIQIGQTLYLDERKIATPSVLRMKERWVGLLLSISCIPIHHTHLESRECLACSNTPSDQSKQLDLLLILSIVKQ
jgi:hypothetical protein